MTQHLSAFMTPKHVNIMFCSRPRSGLVCVRCSLLYASYNDYNIASITKDAGWTIFRNIGYFNYVR